MKALKFISAGLVATFCFAITVGAAVFDLVTNTAPEEPETIAFAAVKGLDFTLSCAEFEARLGLPSGTLMGLTFTELPEQEHAQIYIGESLVQEYQELEREDIDALRIVANGKSEVVRLSFIPDCEGGELTVATVNMLESYNNSPTAESGSCTTIRNTSTTGKINVYDPDGDMVKITVTQKPVKGALTFEGTTYTYRPYLDMTGSDRFTFIAEDEYGNTSKEGFCEVSIEMDTGFYYADMHQNPSHFAAIKLAEKGVFAGEQVGSAYFLHPKQEVTRGELLVALLAAVQADGALPATVHTGLANDGEIPLYLKPYLKLAIDENIIVEDSFAYQEIPTRAEAVVLTKRVAGLPNVESTRELPIPDVAQIPSWAMGAYMDLYAYRMLDLYEDYAYPNDPLTRDYLCDLIWQTYKYVDLIK